MNLGQLCRLIPGLTQMNNRHLGQLLAQLQVCRSVVRRVATEDNQGINLAFVQCLRELLQRVQVERSSRINRLGVRNRLTHCAERDMNGMNQRMNCSRLTRTN